MKVVTGIDSDTPRRRDVGAGVVSAMESEGMQAGPCTSGLEKCRWFMRYTNTKCKTARDSLVWGGGSPPPSYALKSFDTLVSLGLVRLGWTAVIQ